MRNLALLIQSAQIDGEILGPREQPLLRQVREGRDARQLIRGMGDVDLALQSDVAQLAPQPAALQRLDQPACALDSAERAPGIGSDPVGQAFDVP